MKVHLPRAPDDVELLQAFVDLAGTDEVLAALGRGLDWAHAAAAACEIHRCRETSAERARRVCELELWLAHMVTMSTARVAVKTAALRGGRAG